ncbi:MAG: dehH, partial [Acidimicrobiales bacterium]|nr:dehH [Acidimicrobiales bacterium]
GLAAACHRVLASDQRGYSPRARTEGRRSYSADKLVGDVLALADAAGAERFHVVGHDWGGALAWYCAMWHPDRVATMTSLATPHPKAFQRSLLTSTQLLHSWYFLFYQLPRLPEWTATSKVGRRIFRRTLVRSGLSEDKLDTYLTVLDQPGAMTAVINWYRAAPFTPPSRQSDVTVPTLYVYGAGDFALGRRAAELTARYVTGPYRFEVLDDVSHWIPEEVPELVVDLVLDHVGQQGAPSSASAS